MLNAVTVAGLHNNGGGITNWYPGAFDVTIAVGNSNENDVLHGDCRSYMDVAAPGREIPTTDVGACDYVCASGTSLSTPLVSGIAGLMLSQRLNLYNDDVKQILRLSADDRTQPGDCTTVLRVNALQALSRLRSPYQVIHGTAQGGAVVSSVPVELTLFAEPYKACVLEDDEPVCPSQSWSAVRKRVVRTVSFPGELDGAIVGIWGRGAATVGYNDDDKNFAYGWCEFVQGSIDLAAETFKLATYVYELYDEDDNVVDVVPASPANVSLAYTVLEKEDVVSVGPGELVDTAHFVTLRPVSSRAEFRLTSLAGEAATISIFDATGRRIAEAYEGAVPSSPYTVSWDGRGATERRAPSGVYFARLSTGAGVFTQRFVLLK